MYAALKSLLARVLRIPTAPPRPPSGSYDSVQVLRASPRYLRYRLTGVAMGGLFAAGLLLVALVATLAAGEPWGVAVVIVLAGAMALPLALAAFAARLDYDLRTYVITDRSLRVREGAWSIAEMTLTYANVQNVRIEQGPLQRLFRIQDLVVDTAGGGGSAVAGKGGSGGHSVRLRGLEDAPAVRDQLVAHVRRHGRTSGLGDLDDPGEHTRSFERTRASLAATPEVLAALRALLASAERMRAAAGASTRAPGSTSI